MVDDDIRIIIEALNLYANRKLDFVDTLLYAYHKVGHHKYLVDSKASIYVGVRSSL